MDPNKSASAPPLGWADQKSSAGQAPPPPYQDNPCPGLPQPGLAYPPQQQGFGYPPQYPAAGYEQQSYSTGQQYPTHLGPITVQPTVYVTRGPLANPVNDYLGYSIFTMMCCCLPLGIAALIYSISAREANHVGDQMTAERSSRTARTLNHVALGLGIGGVILTIVYIAVVSSLF
ncbi:proline-rich transmembrane protein 1 [Embiotoca jacksoni]|uniref:proline-rich transmembrane protein 1 n=1 Tax=Embiotoca jacksoni TaxID=100190 RepID=UPI003704B3A0